MHQNNKKNKILLHRQDIIKIYRLSELHSSYNISNISNLVESNGRYFIEMTNSLSDNFRKSYIGVIGDAANRAVFNAIRKQKIMKLMKCD